ncbi:MAG: hypothetical protein JNN15_09355, partial [Blastocatellia bacterium]|nr:hypothetical protein [Blastocatellia bacterium]
SSTLLNRYNFANRLITNRNPRGNTVDPKLLLEGSNAQSATEVVNHLLKLLGLYDVDAATKSELKKYLQRNDDGTKGTFKLNEESMDKEVRGLIHLILSLPDYQLN